MAEQANQKEQKMGTPAAQPRNALETSGADLAEDFDDEAEEDLEDDFDEPADEEEEELEDDEEPAPDRPPAKTIRREPIPRAARPIVPNEGAKLVKKESAAVKVDSKFQPRIAYELDKKGKQVLDEDSEPKMLPSGYLRHVGYVNDSGVLFPHGFRFRGGHVANSVEEYGVVLYKCPKCGYRQNVDEAVQGECQNMRSGPEKNEPCGFSAYEELDSYKLAE